MKNLKSKKGGYIMILNTLLFISIVMVIMVAIANITLSHLASTRSFIYSKQAYIASHSAIEEALYRLKSGKQVSTVTGLPLGDAEASATVTTSGNSKSIVSSGSMNGYKRSLRINLTDGTGISFHYGIQSGRGGFELRNSSSVKGNVFSSGSITGAGNYIYGDAISVRSTGLINNIHATGTMYAHTIQNSIADKDAYYTSLINTTVGGVKYPNSPDLPDATFPISDEQIAEWEDQAEDGTIMACTNGSYTINASTTIGPAKIPCDLNIVGSGGGFTVTISGPIWVVGDITTTNRSTIKMDPILGSKNVAIIADDPQASTTKGRISIGQNTSFQDSGSSNSFVFLISQNSSSENGGTIEAIEMNNGASAMVAYASHGQITLAQSVSVKEVTAYKIVLANSASVTYDRGLPNVLFSSGPGGGYDILDWLEI